MIQTLDIDRPGMPDLQFALLVTALCTSRLASLNIPETLRTRVFDRCWVLVHDSPPPRNPQERVLDLRPWTEVTLEAIIETIRSVLTEAGIRTLTWDHPASETTHVSTPQALPLIKRLEQLYPQPSKASDAVSGEAVAGLQDLEDHGPDVRPLIMRMAAFITTFSRALEFCAAEIKASGNNAELADKVLTGADVMRDSGYLYLTWARHYAALSGSNLEAAEGADEGESRV
ncbi:hypothetical protein [Petrachloros mirabilis]